KVGQVVDYTSKEDIKYAEPINANIQLINNIGDSYGSNELQYISLINKQTLRFTTRSGINSYYDIVISNANIQLINNIGDSYGSNELQYISLINKQTLRFTTRSGINSYYDIVIPNANIQLINNIGDSYGSNELQYISLINKQTLRFTTRSGINSYYNIIINLPICESGKVLDNGKCVPKSCDYPAVSNKISYQCGAWNDNVVRQVIPCDALSSKLISEGYIAKKPTNSNSNVVKIPCGPEGQFSAMGPIICTENELTCPNGGTLDGSTCKKSCGGVAKCPQGYTETSGAEVTKGECKGNIDYSYYEYKCNEDKNGQNNNYQIINSGGDCNKSDTNNKTINIELSNSCNSSTPPKNNCKREGFKCNSNERKAVYVENEWRCSPYLCNGDMRCGYGSCENGTEASKDKYQDVAYNPLKQLYAKQCNSALCDYVENRDISYCEKKSCPEGEDIISQDGRCYKIECPKGTYLSGTKCLKSDF
ncbi:hypothetical protein ACOTVS_11070, partial [Aliarcobacter butzleri]